MQLRPATPSDLATMKLLVSEAPAAAQWSDAEWGRIFDPGGSRTAFVWEEGGAVVGFVVARSTGPDWELENIAVRAQARRSGIGCQLLTALISSARASNASAIHLEVRESNQAGRSLYQRCGFRETGRRKAYYTAPVEDAVLYNFSFSSPEK